MSSRNWQPEGPDTAIVASAINTGGIDWTTTTYKTYISCPGADLTDKY